MNALLCFLICVIAIIVSGCITRLRDSPPLLPADTVLRLTVESLVNYDNGRTAFKVVITNTSSTIIRIGNVSAASSTHRIILTSPDDSFAAQFERMPGRFPPRYYQDYRSSFSDPVAPGDGIRFSGVMLGGIDVGERLMTALDYSVSAHVECVDVSYRRFMRVPVQGKGSVIVEREGRGSALKN